MKASDLIYQEDMTVYEYVFKIDKNIKSLIIKKKISIDHILEYKRLLDLGGCNKIMKVFPWYCDWEHKCENCKKALLICDEIVRKIKVVDKEE